MCVFSAFSFLSFPPSQSLKSRVSDIVVAKFGSFENAELRKRKFFCTLFAKRLRIMQTRTRFAKERHTKRTSRYLSFINLYSIEKIIECGIAKSWVPHLSYIHLKSLVSWADLADQNFHCTWKLAYLCKMQYICHARFNVIFWQHLWVPLKRAIYPG